IERVEHRAAHRHSIMTFEHRGGVGEHDRDRIAANETPLAERGGELLRSCMKLAVIATKRSVNDREPIRKHCCRALKKGQWRQGLKIGGIAVEVVIIGRKGHSGSSSRTAPKA